MQAPNHSGQCGSAAPPSPLSSLPVGAPSREVRMPSPWQWPGQHVPRHLYLGAGHPEAKLIGLKQKWGESGSGSGLRRGYFGVRDLPRAPQKHYKGNCQHPARWNPREGPAELLTPVPWVPPHGTHGTAHQSDRWAEAGAVFLPCCIQRGTFPPWSAPGALASLFRKSVSCCSAYLATFTYLNHN